jgi:hypothetical protein
MINEFKYTDKHDWDESRIQKCCPDPKPNPPDPPSSDCCYNTWQSELTVVNWELKEVTNELVYTQKHLTLVTTRFNRLKTWNDELSAANDLAFKICHQLEIIESQLVNICKNTQFTVKGVEILYCMVREFYITLDSLQAKYDSLVNCIKCLNNTALTMTTGIGKVLSDYGTALTAVTGTRDTLIVLVMSAMDSSLSLHRQICDQYGYKRLIRLWQDTLACGVPCEEWTPVRQLQTAKGAPQPERVVPDIIPGGQAGEPFCLEPILHFPICNEGYFKEIHELYEEEKREVKELTNEVKELTKRQLALQAIQQSLQNALKEVNPAMRCS